MTDRFRRDLVLLILVLTAAATLGFGIYTTYDLKRMALTSDCTEKGK